MIEFLADPFASGIGRRALVELLVLGAVCGPLGVWVLLLRHAYAAESLAHAMLPGLAVAALAGLPLALGAGGGILLGASLVALAGRDRRVGGDLGVAVAITALTGLGAVLALSPNAPARLTDLLFGDLLALTTLDIAISLALAVAVLAVLAVAHRPLTLAAFDAGTARALGTRPGRVDLLVLLLLALAVAVAVRALGTLLAVALLLAPAAAAMRLTGRLPAVIALAAALALLAGVLGLYVTHYLRLAAGASVALVAVAVFVTSLLADEGGARRRGPGGPVEALGEAL